MDANTRHSAVNATIGGSTLFTLFLGLAPKVFEAIGWVQWAAALRADQLMVYSAAINWESWFIWFGLMGLIFLLLYNKPAIARCREWYLNRYYPVFDTSLAEGALYIAEISHLGLGSPQPTAIVDATDAMITAARAGRIVIGARGKDDLDVRRLSRWEVQHLSIIVQSVMNPSVHTGGQLKKKGDSGNEASHTHARVNMDQIQDIWAKARITGKHSWMAM